jgi:hypothetical protein
MDLKGAVRRGLAALLIAGSGWSACAAAQSAQFPSVPAATPAPANSIPAVAPPTPGQQPAAAPTATKVPAQTVPVVAAPQAVSAKGLPSLPAYDPDAERALGDWQGSAYIPVDSPVYPMALRLYSMGYLDSAFISMRPWTRRSLLHMLEKSSGQITQDNDDEAMALLARLEEYVADEDAGPYADRGTVSGLDTVYTRFMGIGGQTLRDSYHLGQTIVNDYGRPYATGFNNVTGFSARTEWWRFSLFARGEYEHAPGFNGYSYALANQLTCGDLIGCPMATTFYQDTLPYGNTGARNPMRLQEASVSLHVLGHEISGGKTDAWEGPGFGGAMAWSNNAEDIYSFRINRVEPLHIPLVSRLLGPLRYDFFVGSLKGHTVPNDPWIHSEQFSFRPTKNFEFAFQRSVIWGGKGHEPITLHTFLRSFFSISDTTAAEKNSASDPGARYSDFSFSYRLPFVRKYVTLYADSEAHDDVTPVSAPRRAAYRPGIYLSHLPHMEKLDFRVEAASTDTSTLRSIGGEFNYYEVVQRQGYTNKGFILGDWIGREAKGGQAWLTWHLSADEFVQVEYLNKKTPKDFIAGGTTQNQMKVDVVKWLGHQIQMDAWVQYERWKAPVPQSAPNDALTITGGPLYYPGAKSDTVVAAQFTWYPHVHRD